ncbi:MAG: hypothetical protein H6834_09120 [Planctomycetes bacterium]|nr:hypothetical protein [Planctomycetota bacterium]
MLHLTLCLLLVLQEPGPAPGEVGKLRWPPSGGEPLHYRIVTEKVRSLPSDVAKREQSARKTADLPVDRKVAKQKARVQVDLALACDGQQVRASYATRLLDHDLRMKVVKPTDETAKVEALGNGAIAAVWGHPSVTKEKPLDVESTRVERQWNTTFQRRSEREVRHADLSRSFGDHLLPVLWDYPLPCWAEQLVAVLDLRGEAIIEGKSLIRDRTDSLPLGNRNTRVELFFTKATSESFSMKYSMQVEQLLARERDLSKVSDRGEVWWRFEIEGTATYTFADAALDEVRETVRGFLKEPREDLLTNLRDEYFEGKIRVDRVKPEATSGSKRRGRGKR